MTRQILDTTAGAGDTGKAGGDKINANLAELYALAYPSRCRIRFIGDSKSNEPAEALGNLLARDPRDVELAAPDSTYDEIGSSNTTTTSGPPLGLTNPTRMAGWKANIATDVAAGYTVDVICTIGTNNSASGNPEGALADVRRAFNEALASGARYFIAMGADPRGTPSNPSTGSGMTFIVSYNRGLARMAREFPRFKFVDTFPALNDYTVNGFALRGPSGTSAVGSPSNDGLHLSGYGCFLKQFALVDLVRSLYAPRPRPIPFAGDDYSAGNGSRSNLIGPNGRFIANGSSLNVGTKDSATSSGTFAAGYGGGASISGTMSLVMTMVNCPVPLVAGGGLVRALKLAFSGTPSEDGYFTGQIVSDTATQGVTYRHTVTQYLEGVSGFLNAFTATNNRVSNNGSNPAYSPLQPIRLNSAGRPTAPENDLLNVPDGFYTIDETFIAPVTAQLITSVSLNWRAGSALSGNFYLIGHDLHPVLPAPDAATS